MSCPTASRSRTTTSCESSGTHSTATNRASAEARSSDRSSPRSSPTSTRSRRCATTTGPRSPARRAGALAHVLAGGHVRPLPELSQAPLLVLLLLVGLPARLALALRLGVALGDALQVGPPGSLAALGGSMLRVLGLFPHDNLRFPSMMDRAGRRGDHLSERTAPSEDSAPSRCYRSVPGLVTRPDKAVRALADRCSQAPLRVRSTQRGEALCPQEP